MKLPAASRRELHYHHAVFMAGDRLDPVQAILYENYLGMNFALYRINIDTLKERILSLHRKEYINDFKFILGYKKSVMFK